MIFLSRTPGLGMLYGLFDISLFMALVILLGISLKRYLTRADEMPSGPGLLLFLSLFIAFWTSNCVIWRSMFVSCFGVSLSLSSEQLFVRKLFISSLVGEFELLLFVSRSLNSFIKKSLIFDWSNIVYFLSVLIILMSLSLETWLLKIL